MGKNNSFTLLELIIVIVILGILAALGITNYQSAIERARGDAYINNLRTIMGAWRIYNLREATDYTASAINFQNVQQINNRFGTLIDERYFGNTTTNIPGAYFISNTTNSDLNLRFLRLLGYRISGTLSGRLIRCTYYYQRTANTNIWDWGGTWPWLPTE